MVRTLSIRPLPKRRILRATLFLAVVTIIWLNCHPPYLPPLPSAFFFQANIKSTILQNDPHNEYPATSSTHEHPDFQDQAKPDKLPASKHTASDHEYP